MLTPQQIGAWSFQTDAANTLTMDLRADYFLRERIFAWERAFTTRENTWVRTAIGVPSLLIRIDFVVTPEEKIFLFEVEERPSGIALTAAINPQFRDLFADLREHWENVFGRPIAWVISESYQQEGETDDALLADFFRIPIYYGVPPSVNGTLLYVRSLPSEKTYHSLAERAISTVAVEGDKQYGNTLGWWSTLPSELPWRNGFATKPRQGSRMRKGIYLFPPPEYLGKATSHFHGRATRARIEQARDNGEIGYIQPWIWPEKHGFLPDEYWLVRRVYFGLYPDTRQWKCLGGFWNACPSLRVHGTRDAILGCVTIKE